MAKQVERRRPLNAPRDGFRWAATVTLRKEQMKTGTREAAAPRLNARHRARGRRRRSASSSRRSRISPQSWNARKPVSGLATRSSSRCSADTSPAVSSSGTGTSRARWGRPAIACCQGNPRRRDRDRAADLRDGGQRRV